MLYDLFKTNKAAAIVEQYKEVSQSKVIWKNWLLTKKQSKETLKEVNTYDEYFKIQEEEKEKYGDLYSYNYSKYSIEHLGEFEDNLKLIIKFLIANVTYKKHIAILKDLDNNLERFVENVINNALIEDFTEDNKTIYRYNLSEDEATGMEDNYMLQTEFMTQYLEKATKKIIKIVDENNVVIFK